ncbi:MAG: type II toxin-antitoxin system RelE/ParE family toxin [Endomicrobiales bacterium]|jgi:phage-related protein
MFEIKFYEDEKGRCEVDEFLNALQLKLRAKALKWMEKLKQEGPNLPRPFADIVNGKIRELRVRFGSDSCRFLYFFYEKVIIITHGFMKKTEKVPDNEILHAERIMKEFVDRNN